MSLHPVIGQGLRGVEVCLGAYHPVLADDFSTFVAVLTTHLRRKSVFLIMAPWDARGNYRLMRGLSREAIRENISRIQEILEAWHKYVSDKSVVSPKAMPCIKALIDAHKIYKQRYEDQRQMLEQGTVAEIVAKALARMSGTTQSLMFTDATCDCWVDERDLWLEAAIQGPGILAEFFVQTTSRMEIALLDHRFDPTPPVNLMIDIFAAWPRDGFMPNKLTINFEGVDSTALLIPTTPQARDNLQFVAQHLKDVFISIEKRTLRTVGPATQARSVQRAKNAYEFLSIILDSESIDHIVLTFCGIGTEGPTAPSIGPIILGTSRPKLWGLQLLGVSLTGDELLELSNIIVPNPKGGMTVALDTIYLLQGLWKPGVDALDAKIKGLLVFHFVGGGEALYLPKKEFAMIFGKHLVPC
ncbi:hypothetical protein F5Y08DRAFT_348214 [Xylaria arbuscula]|nr:hypothetical protein F5Y08DRAFT_348214 [Xylaria arbuscula]